jgi:hypothetical protein
MLAFNKNPSGKLVNLWGNDVKIESEGASDFEPYYYLANENSKYSPIFLRSSSSFDSLTQFVFNFKNQILNVKLSNGLSSVNIVDVLTGANRGSSFRFLANESAIPITLTDGNGIDGIRSWQTSFNAVMPNSDWDSKIFIYSGLQNKWLAGDQYYSSSDIPEQYKVKRDNSYFSLYFASYVQFCSDYQELYAKYRSKAPSDPSKSQLANALSSGQVQVKALPLQLTMIGNEEAVVFKGTLINSVSLDEISKITKYSVDAKK